MTIKTVTFDDTTHKLVPLEPTKKQINIVDSVVDEYMKQSLGDRILKAIVIDIITAAPEYEGLPQTKTLIEQQNEAMAAPIKQNNGSAYD